MTEQRLNPRCNLTRLALNLTVRSNCSRIRNATPTSIPSTCGVCSEQCIWTLVSLIFIIGVVANAVIIILVAKDRKLRKPIFVAVATLSFADMVFLTANIISKMTRIVIIQVLMCTTSYEPKHVTRALFAVLWFSSSAHVAYLAVVRYIMLAKPIKALALLTNRRIVLCSIGLWIASTVIFTSIAATVPDAGKSVVGIVTWFLTYLLPITVTIVLHVFRVTSLRRSLRRSSSTGTESRKKSIQIMTKTIIIVVTLTMVCPIPRLVDMCLRTLGNVQFPSRQFTSNYEGISFTCFMFSFSLNPFLYAYMSPAFREGLKRMFLCPKRRRESYVSSSVQTSRKTTISSISREPEQCQ